MIVAELLDHVLGFDAECGCKILCVVQFAASVYDHRLFHVERFIIPHFNDIIPCLAAEFCHCRADTRRSASVEDIDLNRYMRCISIILRFHRTRCRFLGHDPVQLHSVK